MTVTPTEAVVGNTGHGELRRAIGLKKAWNFHGEVLLRHILWRLGRP